MIVRIEIRKLVFYPIAGLIVLVVFVIASKFLITSMESDDSPSQMITPAQTLTPTSQPKTVPVIVALQPISRNTRITADLIGLRHWPESSVELPGVIANKSVALNQMVRTDIVQGQLIVPRMFTTVNEWGLSSYPAIDRDLIFYTDLQYLYAVSTETGQEVWHFEPENDRLRWSSPPAAAAGFVYYSVAEVDRWKDILNSN